MADRIVMCAKLHKELPGLKEPPFNNELGQRVYETISQEAWKAWVDRMKMIMNEYRLNLGTKEAQDFLLQQMEEYFWGEGGQMPPEYKPEGH